MPVPLRTSNKNRARAVALRRPVPAPLASVRLLPKRVKPRFVIIDQNMGLFNLFGRHFFNDFLLGDRRVRVATDGGKHIPRVSPNQIGSRHAPANLIIPANARLGAGVSFKRCPQVPVKRPHVIARHSKTHGIHDADQFFRVGISRPGRRQKLLHRLFELALFHQVTRRFNFRVGTYRKHQKYKQKNRTHQFLPYLVALLFMAPLPLPLQANQLPSTISESDFHPVDMQQAKLGQLLFYDPILSGNRNISCGTCHSPDHGTSDGLSLGIGEGGKGVGPERTAGVGDDRIKKRIPRNASALWNLGARDIDVLFHDGRLSFSDAYGNGFNSPAEEWLPKGLSTILAAQALFPLTAQFEMAGNPKENQVAGAAHDRIDYVWPILTKRVRIIPEYGRMFVNAFDDVSVPEQVTISHIANALAAFMNHEWQSIDSRYDQYLAGNRSVLSATEKAGMDLFFGKGRCATCHSGQLLSDQKFHALALPHFGPGRTRRFDPYVRDVGLMGESDRLEDAYRFRTPMLRNVVLTGPYGHNGAYPTLKGIIRHHLDPKQGFASWTPELAALPKAEWLSAIDFVAFQDRRERARLASQIDIRPVDMDEPEIEALVDFMNALTGTDSVEGRLGKPKIVPSGLQVD